MGTESRDVFCEDRTGPGLQGRDVRYDKHAAPVSFVTLAMANLILMVTCKESVNIDQNKPEHALFRASAM